MRKRVLAALAAGVLVVLLLGPQQRTHAQSSDLVTLTSEITYDIKTVNDAVRVTWDATVSNNDPSSTFRNGSGFYYFSYPLPILHGASSVSAVSERGQPLNVELVDVGSPLVQSAAVSFDRGIFYGETYSFRLTYDVIGAHSRSAIVTPYYAYVAVVAAGDPATVTVNIPGQDPWSTSLEGAECAQDGPRFTCSGSQGPFIAAIAETAQPGRTGTLTFDVQLADKVLSVSLKYFEGDEATAQRQQVLIAASLPIIEEAFGFSHPGPTVLNISQGGQQAVLGYEGLTACGADSCDIVISPIASDYTVLHELAHMWTGIFDERWLAEGFAELVANTTGPQLPEGVVSGPAPERTPATIPFQLDDWGPAGSLIGADPDLLTLEDAGYDYSNRFMQQLRDTFGVTILQAVNRNIATSGGTADSRRYMDLLEEATGRNVDNLFLAWVFPQSQRPVIEDRREARDRLGELSNRLASEGLREGVLAPIRASIADWDFAAALGSLARAEAGLETYVSLLPQLEALRTAAEEAGLKLPATIESALINFDFDSVRDQLADAEEALAAYTVSAEKTHAGRGLWTRFGLLGADPDGALRNAAKSFTNGDFETSRVQSEHAMDLIEGASGVAFRRLLLVAGLLAILALAVGIAVAVGHFRERGLAER